LFLGDEKKKKKKTKLIEGSAIVEGPSCRPSANQPDKKKKSAIVTSTSAVIIRAAGLSLINKRPIERAHPPLPKTKIETTKVKLS